MSSSRRGGLRSHGSRTTGQTKEQLYNEAKRLNIKGRSRMNKRQLLAAVNRKKS
jgi:predicted metallopeptidase